MWNRCWYMNVRLSAPTSGACSLWYPAWCNEPLFSYLLDYPHFWKHYLTLGPLSRLDSLALGSIPLPCQSYLENEKITTRHPMLGHDNEVFSHHFAQIEICHCTSAKDYFSWRRFLSYMYPTAFHFQAASVAMTNLLESHSDFQARTSPPCGWFTWLIEPTVNKQFLFFPLIAILQSEMLL